MPQETLPSVEVLVYAIDRGEAGWQDFWSRCRTRAGLERQLRRGVRDGVWVGWRFIHIEKEVIGNGK